MPAFQPEDEWELAEVISTLRCSHTSGVLSHSVPKNFSFTVFDKINSGLIVCTWLKFNKKLYWRGKKVAEGVFKCFNFLCSTYSSELMLRVFRIKPLWWKGSSSVTRPPLSKTLQLPWSKVPLGKKNPTKQTQSLKGKTRCLRAPIPSHPIAQSLIEVNDTSLVPLQCIILGWALGLERTSECSPTPFPNLLCGKTLFQWSDQESLHLSIKSHI